jgi:high frequency lysogenization protein
MSNTHASWLEQQTIALAGVAQAARLVDQVSKTGSYPLEFLEPSIHSLFVFDQDQAQEIYGGLGGVKLGLHNLASLMANRQSQENQEVARYFLSLLYLERRFASDAQMMAVVRSRLEHTSFKAEHFSSDIKGVCHSVSGIYQDTLSQLKFRIRVTGSATHLENSQNADIIRATLLSGVRAAFLWHQLGGRRWQLIFRRRKVLQCAQHLSRSLSVV